MIHPSIYAKLCDVAANELVVFYHQVAPLAGLDMSLPDDRNRIADILDEISTFEHEQDRPLLSVVVVQTETGRPGKGFYKLATRLGLFSGKSDLDEMDCGGIVARVEGPGTVSDFTSGIWKLWCHYLLQGWWGAAIAGVLKRYNLESKHMDN